MSQIRKESSPLTDVMEYYDAEMTRDEYVLTNFVGEVEPDAFIPVDVEATFPAQFRRRTLLDTPSASNSVQ
ncbi:MAG TPA: hypothetical protein VK722_18300 [Candidatus Aquilonibacter sp.]|jgi:hypothetical protein|nr:hypothetical protein [Candidatus Aquilonibacter sp.]